MRRWIFAGGFLSIFLPISYSLPAADNRVEIPYSSLSYVVVLGLFMALAIGVLADPRRAVAEFRIATTPLLTLVSVGAFVAAVALFTGGARPFVPVYLWVSSVIALAVLFHATVTRSEQTILSSLALTVLIVGVVSTVVAYTAMLRGGLYLGPFEVRQGGIGRLNGWYGSPNRLGGFLAVAILAGGYLLTRYRGGAGRLLVFGGLIVVLSGLIPTANRSGIGALVAAGTMFLFLLSPGRDAFERMLRGGGRLVVAAVLLTAVAFSAYALGGQELLELYGRQSGFDPQADIRFTLWSLAMKELGSANLLELLFGRGYRYFQDTYGLHPHNGYVRFAVEYGLIFVGAFILLVATFLREALRRSRAEGAFLCSLIVFYSLRDLLTTDLFQVKIETLTIAIVVAVCIVRGPLVSSIRSDVPRVRSETPHSGEVFG